MSFIFSNCKPKYLSFKSDAPIPQVSHAPLDIVIDVPQIIEGVGDDRWIHLPGVDLFVGVGALRVAVDQHTMIVVVVVVIAALLFGRRQWVFELDGDR